MSGTEQPREQAVIRAFLELSNELVDDYDVIEMLTRLTANCAQLLDIASAGLLLADHRGVLHLAAASSELARDLEVLQLQRDEGPCLDCYHTRAVVVATDLRAQAGRWPQFAAAALSAGFVSVHALPMRLRDSTLGALGLFGDQPGRLGEPDLELAQALVHVASIVIVSERAASDRATINGQLQRALSSRVVLEQAKGVLANAGELDMEDAFHVLRQYARDHSRRLTEVARSVVARELSARVLLDHVHRASPPG